MRDDVTMVVPGNEMYYEGIAVPEVLPGTSIIGVSPLKPRPLLAISVQDGGNRATIILDLRRAVAFYRSLGLVIAEVGDRVMEGTDDA